jgi:hypothetical protein
MNVKRLLFVGGVMVVGFALSVLATDKLGQKNAIPPKEELPASTDTNLAVSTDFPVILFLERRGQTIAVKAGPKGPIYSAKTTEGKILFENLSAEQLRAQAPELHEFIKSAMAGGSGRSGVVMDARVRIGSPGGQIR